MARRYPAEERAEAGCKRIDGLLSEELASKQHERIAMHVQIAHFPVVKTLDDFEFKFQPISELGYLSRSAPRISSSSSSREATKAAFCTSPPTRSSRSGAWYSLSVPPGTSYLAPVI